MQGHGAYTDSSTGFHMGVSIPQMENVDYIKLILFLGDKYVLEEFGRLGNSYTRSALDKMQTSRVDYVVSSMPNVFDMLRSGLNKAALKLIEGKLVPRNDKYTSVNIKDNYIEFRSAGGNYLETIEKIKNTLLRYVRVMALAADENEAKQEYAKKFYKLLYTYSRKGNEKENNVIKLFSMFASGNLSKEELIQKVKAAQNIRQRGKRGPVDYAILDRNGDPITIVKAIDNSDALTKGMEWERSNPVSGGVRGVRLATADDYKTITQRKAEQEQNQPQNNSTWNRYFVYGYNEEDNVSSTPIHTLSARDNQEATRLALQWGRENNVIISGIREDARESKRPDSLAGYIAESNRLFVWEKQEPKKEFTDMQLACILGGQEYTGELK
jgi:hypothetical protein